MIDNVATIATLTRRSSDLACKNSMTCRGVYNPCSGIFLLFDYALCSTIDSAAQSKQPQKPTLSEENQLLVSSENLISEHGEHGPDKSVRFDALAQLDSNEHMVVNELLDGILLKHQARRLAGSAV